MLWRRTPSTRQSPVPDGRAARLRGLLLRDAAVLGVGLAYFLLVSLTGWGIPCIFYTLTGLQCPGCGVSRMLLSLARLDLAAAFGYNPFLLLTSPLLLFCLVLSDVRYVRSGNRSLGKWEILLWIEIALALVFAVLRNLW